MATSRTVRELLERSLRLIGALALGETAKPPQLKVALQVFQDFLAENNADLFVPFVTISSFTLSIGTGSYTIGQDGNEDVTAQRPENITDAWIRDSGGYDHPVAVISEADYNAIRTKTIQGRPDKLWYNPTAPNGTVYLWTVPDAAESLYYSDKLTLSEPTKLTDKLLDTVGIPRSYHNPLGYMMAIELAPEYGREPSPLVIARASGSRNKIGAINLARSMQGAVIEPGTEEQRGTGRSILNY